MALAVADLLDHRGGAHHQGAAQGLVTRAGDHAEPHLAGSGMIPWGQTCPGREVAAATEGLRVLDLDRQQTAADWPMASTSARRRLISFCRCQAFSFTSISRSSIFSRLNSWPCMANSSLANSGTLPSSATRASNGSTWAGPLAAAIPNSAA